MRMWASIVVVGASFLSGCGTTCQSTCSRIHSTNECRITTAGFDDEAGRTELIRQCVDMCSNALTSPGELGSYNPNERSTTGETIALTNEVQAAAWMDCIEETACEQIDSGFCQPLK